MTADATVISAAIEIEGADAAFDQPARPAARADDRRHGGVAADDERREQQKRSE